MAQLVVLDQRQAVGESIGLMEKLGFLWCRSLHNSPMWPIHGHYTCRVCLRQYSVTWDSRLVVDTIEIAPTLKVVPLVSKIGHADSMRPESRHAVAVG